ncbi:MAG: tetratricopeptide repeat protein [Vicinamibacterales bacterium]
MTADTDSRAVSTRDAGLRRIETLLQQGRVEAALAEQEEFLRTRAQDLALPNSVGELYLQAGLVDRAVPLFFRSANAYLAEGFAARAAACYRKVLKFAPDHEETLIRLARACAGQGLLADARSCLDKVIAARQGRNDTGGLHEVVALLHTLQADVRPQPILDPEPRSESCEIELEFPEDGKTDVEPMSVEILPVELEPEPGAALDSGAETDLLALLSELHDDEIDLMSMFDENTPVPIGAPPGDSLDEAFAGLRSAPRTPVEQLALGRTLLEAGLAEQARGPLTAAVADPSCGYDAAIALARIAQDAGHAEQLAVWLERAAQLATSPARQGAALYRLGLVLEREGSNARALAAFESLATLAPDFRDVAERVNRLRGGAGGGSSIR